MMDNKHSVFLFPCLYDVPEGSDRPRQFSVMIGKTEYTVTTHFDPKGRQTMFRKMKDIVLSDP